MSNGDEIDFGRTLHDAGSPLQKGARLFEGRFELLEFAGRGGMGEVWQARDAELGGDVVQVRDATEDP